MIHHQSQQGLGIQVAVLTQNTENDENNDNRSTSSAVLNSSSGSITTSSSNIGNNKSSPQHSLLNSPKTPIRDRKRKLEDIFDKKGVQHLLTTLSENFQRNSKQLENQLTQDFNKLLTTLNAEIFKIECSKEEFDKDYEDFKGIFSRLSKISSSTNNKIRLNIGGQLFTTSLDTLTSEKGTFFTAMFSEQFHTQPDEDGEYFIDRDSKHFPTILNYLRDPMIQKSFSFLDYNEKELRELKNEVDYYQIRSFQRMIEEEENFGGISAGKRILLSHKNRIVTKIVQKGDGEWDSGVLFPRTKRWRIKLLSKDAIHWGNFNGSSLMAASLPLTMITGGSSGTTSQVVVSATSVGSASMSNSSNSSLLGGNIISNGGIYNSGNGSSGSAHNVIMIGVADGTRYQSNGRNFQNCGFYLYTLTGSLYSERDVNRMYANEIPSEGAVIEVCYRHGTLSFIINGINYNNAYTGLSEGLQPAFDICSNAHFEVEKLE